MNPLARFTPDCALALTLAWIGLLVLGGSTEALLFLAPALLIAIPLLGGRYLGEELIARLVARRERARRRPATVAERLPAPARRVPRGNRLLAFGLAKRPPPAFAPLLLN